MADMDALVERISAKAAPVAFDKKWHDFQSSDRRTERIAVRRYVRRAIQALTHDDLKSLIEASGERRVVPAEDVDHLVATLKRAANQFANYYNNHMAKTPPDKDKADTNAAWALICNEAAHSIATPEAGRKP